MKSFSFLAIALQLASTSTVDASDLSTMSMQTLSNSTLSMTAPMTIPSLQESGNSGGVDAAACLAAHNKVRQAVGVPPLKWDDALAAKGAQWAQHMEDQGFFAHNTPGKSDPQMNNLYSGTDCLAAVNAFESEKSKFPADRIVRAETYMQYGHYSMMVWKTTTRVGCGRGKTKNLACYYEEPGNMIGKPAY